MTRLASFIALAAFLTFGLGTAVSFASEPAPVEQKDKKDMSGSKADDDSKKKDGLRGRNRRCAPLLRFTRFQILDLSNL